MPHNHEHVHGDRTVLHMGMDHVSVPRGDGKVARRIAGTIYTLIYLAAITFWAWVLLTP